MAWHLLQNASKTEGWPGFFGGAHGLRITKYRWLISGICVFDLCFFCSDSTQETGVLPGFVLTALCWGFCFKFGWFHWGVEPTKPLPLPPPHYAAPALWPKGAVNRGEANSEGVGFRWEKEALGSGEKFIIYTDVWFFIFFFLPLFCFCFVSLTYVASREYRMHKWISSCC